MKELTIMASIPMKECTNQAKFPLAMYTLSGKFTKSIYTSKRVQSDLIVIAHQSSVLLRLGDRLI